MTIDWNTLPPSGYWRNHRGDLIRETNITESERDMDATVRRIIAFGTDLSAQMWRFRTRTLLDIYDYVDRVVSGYGGKIGGRKGNVTLTSFDGRLQVRLAQAELVHAGPELAAAQAIIEECIDEWSRHSSINLRALVDAAFKPDATGNVSVSQLLRLRRVQIDDPRWRRAQDAIADALRPVGRAEYVRLYRRATPPDPWQPIALHLATVARPPDAERNEDAGPEAALERRVRSAVTDARHCGMRQGTIRTVLLGAMRLREPRGEGGGNGDGDVGGAETDAGTGERAPVETEAVE